MSDKNQKKVKFIKFMHTAVDKTGKVVRKAGPWLGSIAVAVFAAIVSSGKNDSDKD